MLRDRHIDASSRSCKCVAFSRYGVHVAVVIDDSPVNINIFSISSAVKDVNLSSLCKHTDVYLYGYGYGYLCLHSDTPVDWPQG